MARLFKTSTSTHPASRMGGVVSRALSRLAGAARIFVDAVRTHKNALLFSALCFASSAAWSTTPAGSTVSNTATASYTVGGTGYTGNGTASFNMEACSTSGIKAELMQYIPPARAAHAPAGAATYTVQPGEYSNGGGYSPLTNNPTLLDVGPTALPASLLLAPLIDAANGRVSSYMRNETILVRVISYDANTNPGVADTVTLTLTTASGDSETLRLTETDISTGVFIGAIPSVFSLGGTPVANNGQILAVAHNEQINLVYTHSSCGAGADIAYASSGLIDPYGTVFDSVTGAPVDGATIGIVDAVTGLPTTVYCDDGSVMNPQIVTTGSTTSCDPLSMEPGGYRLPLVAAGSYKLTVTPPAGHSFPSAVPAASLPPTVGVPAIVPSIMGNPSPVPGASYGGVFSLWGPALRIDVPVDSGGGTTLTLQKSAGKSVVGTGEFVPYTLTITNNNAAPLAGVQIADHTPPGFRYQKGSARLDGAAVADPAISADARTLTFSLNIAASSAANLRYVLEVTPGAHTGTAENTAVATGGATSNTARASVVVREDLYRNKTILIGRVIDGPCSDKVDNGHSKSAALDSENGHARSPHLNPLPPAGEEANDTLRVFHDNGAKGLADARIVLQDGTYVLTDPEGRWHIDNVRPGTHVVQLDLDSLPDDYEVVACEKNTRFAGRMYSQFVNVHGGTLWRADFHVQKKASESARLTQTLSAQRNEGKTGITLNLAGTAKVTGYSATLMLPESARYVPGSATLNSVAIADPDIMGAALIFRSQVRPAQWQDKYTVAVEGIAQNADIQSMVRFTAPGRPAQNTPAARVTLVENVQSAAETFALIAVESTDTQSAKTPQKSDPNRLVEKLPYDEKWLVAAQPGIEWLHPQESFHPNIPAIKAAIKHLPGQTTRLILNGEEVSQLYYDGAQTNAARTVSLAIWNGVHIKDGDNRLELIVSDADGKEASRTVRNIHYATELDHVELMPKQSRPVADGKTRPVIAVRFLDKDGYPLRRGINGEFTINEPYRSYDRREGIDREPLGGRVGGKPRFEITSDGIALIELEPTIQSGEAVLQFQFNDKRTQEVRAWLEAGQRDWILVGFAEGTAGHKALSGNIQALQEAGADEQLFDGNKLAFYAKGTIKGEYLLTAAYDTSKQTGNKQLKQMVDPAQYYTLYADASQAGYDAASASRLYLKLERRQFYAMFGDYDTGLTVTELSRYSRTLNGVKSEYKGETLGYNAFATVTAQAYVKDEIPGNGTSGVYRLSRGNLMANSDKIRIDTRDRFQSHIIVSTHGLTRYLDYDIDYDKGTLTFREPVSVRDEALNPTYIIAEYESADPADKRATFGGRGSFKPTPQTEIGATLVHEGTMGATSNLQGLDATYQANDKTKLRAEAASTDRNNAGAGSGGSAWLGEVQHHEERWDAKAYLREQDSSFGSGQQAGPETGTRKMGVDGRLKMSDTMQLQGQAYRQETLGTGARHTLLEGRVNHQLSNDLNAYYGGRTARDSSAADDTESNQVITGAAYTLLDRKLALRAAAEISDGAAGSVNMPDRLTLGTDYKVAQQTSVFAEQEFARGEKLAANTTRAGLRSQPWSGGEVSASVGNTSSNDAERLYSNLGLIQRWQINERWQTDFKLDRSQTLRNTATPLNINTPLPSGSMTGDYTAAAAGAAYHDPVWSGNGRIEIRNASTDQQKNLQFGMQRNLDEGRTLAGGLSLRNANSAGNTSNSGNLNFSYAHRPNDSRWVWFDRADYITQLNQTAGSSVRGAKLVNNLNANYMPNRHTQIALQYGAKYVLETIDGADYKGYTDLLGAEIRHDLAPDWDIGASGSMMRSLNSGVRDYALGVSVGYEVMENMWLSVGYNVRGLNDRDFSAATYRAHGLFATLRVKIDQDTLGLNKRGKTMQTATPEK